MTREEILALRAREPKPYWQGEPGTRVIHPMSGDGVLLHPQELALLCDLALAALPETVREKLTDAELTAAICCCFRWHDEAWAKDQANYDSMRDVLVTALCPTERQETP